MPNATPTTYKLNGSIALEITVADADAVERVTGAEGDEWRELFYNLHTLDDVLEHWTYNALVNGVRDVSRLDGWADLPITAVVIELEYTDVERMPDDA